MRFSIFALFAAQAAARSMRHKPVLDSDTLIIDGPEVNDLSKRQQTSCDDTKVLQNFLNPSYVSSASDFCSTWLQTTSTSTQLNVVTALATTTIQPKKGATVTTTSIIYVTKTTGTTTVTQVPTLTTLQIPTDDAQQAQKRDNSIPYPTWFAKSYAPAKVSSACSCVIPSPSPAVQVTVSVTTTTTIMSTVSIPTQTTTVTKSSTTTVKVAATLTVNCGIVGCSIGDYIIDASQDYRTLAKCKAYCLTQPSCLGYQFTVGDRNNCNIASVNASTLYSGYSYLFTQCSQSQLYDRNCGV